MQGGSMDNVHNLTPEQDIEQQAADWLLRLDAEHKPSKSEIDELTAWVQRSPAHKEQLQRLAQYWHCANLPAELSLAPSGSAPSEPGNGNLLSRLFSSGWRATATLGVALSIAGALTMNLLTSDTSGISGNGIYETRTGEQNSITLRDGSVIQLNTGSRIHINFVDKQRTVSLIAGEVHFQVAKDKTRPFIVKAGEGLVRAVGTAFSVRLHPEAVKVVVDEGKVALATSLDPPNSKNGSSRDTAETVRRAVDRGYLVQGQPMSTSIPGQCLCGRITFSAQPITSEMDACHCTQCRKWSGGVLFAVVCSSVQINNESELTAYQSSDWGERLFCRHCGSNLFWRSLEHSIVAVMVQAFDDPSQFEFTREAFIDEKPGNYSFADKTHRMTGEEFMGLYDSSGS